MVVQRILAELTSRPTTRKASMSATPFNILAKAAAAFATLTLTSCTNSEGLAGSYSNVHGIWAEFIEDGTAVFTVKGKQTIWKWTAYETNRLKLEPEQGISDDQKAQMCNYLFDGDVLQLTDCDFSISLTRR